MTSFFKSFGKGILYIVGLPFALVFLAIVAVIGIPVIVFLFIKSIFLFFKGATLDTDFEEDIQAKKILNPELYVAQDSVPVNEVKEEIHDDIPEVKEEKTNEEINATYLFTPNSTFVPVIEEAEPEKEVDIEAIDEQDVLDKVYEDSFLDEPKPVTEEEALFVTLDEPEDNEEFIENDNQDNQKIYFGELDMGEDEDEEYSSISLSRGEDK